MATRIEAESFTIVQGFSVESTGGASGGARLKGNAGDICIARHTHALGDGVFDVVIGHWDESDGQSTSYLRVNGAQVETWLWNVDADQGSPNATSGAFVDRTVAGVQLRDGDVIEWEVRPHTGEAGRTDYFDFTYTGPIPSAVRIAPVGLSSGSVAPSAGARARAQLDPLGVSSAPETKSAILTPSARLYAGGVISGAALGALPIRARTRAAPAPASSGATIPAGPIRAATGLSPEAPSTPQPITSPAGLAARARMAGRAIASAARVAALGVATGARFALAGIAAAPILATARAGQQAGRIASAARLLKLPREPRLIALAREDRALTLPHEPRRILSRSDVQKWPNKDPGDTLDYEIDWSAELAGDTIEAAEWIVPAGLVRESSSRSGGIVSVWLSGGAANREYRVTSRITTTGGRTIERSAKLYVTER